MPITIYWEALDTVTAADGGDTVTSTLGIISIDGAEEEQYTRAAEISTHAVERGSSISDNIRAGNRGIVLNCFVSSDPQTVRENLDFLIRSEQLCTIETDLGEYENMVLTSISESRNHRTGNALVCTIEAQQVRVVDTQEIAAPAPVVERGRRRTQAGAQSTRSTTNATTTPPSTAATQRQSMLDSIGELTGILRRRDTQ